MQNFGQNIQRTSILSELSNANAELGEGFAHIMAEMIMQSGIYNPKAEDYQLVSPSWKKLAAKPDKTEQEIEQLDKMFKDEIHILAESYLLFMARETRNLTGKLEYAQYEAYMLKYRFGRYDIMNQPDYLRTVKEQIRNAFNKISAHGELTGGDNLIDKMDMASFLYALTMKATRKDNKFSGFEINGTLKPIDYAVCEKQLFDKEDNLFSIQLRTAYKVLTDQI